MNGETKGACRNYDREFKPESDRQHPAFAQQWHTVQIIKVLNYFGSYYTVGSTIDTITTDTFLVVPQAYIYQNTSYSTDSIYSFLDMGVAPINGPVPLQWDSLTSFEGNGYLPAFYSRYQYVTPTAFPTLQPRPKRSTKIGRTPWRRHITGELVRKLVTRSVP